MQEDLELTRVELSRAHRIAKELEAEQSAGRENSEKVLRERLQRSRDLSKKLSDAAKGKGGAHSRVAKLASAGVSVQAMRADMAGVSAELSGGVREMLHLFSTLRVALASLTELADNTQANYQKECEDRRRLFDQLQEVRGNIRVYCRVRPLSAREREAGVEECVEFPGEGQVAFNALAPLKGDAEKGFTFDRVFGPLSTQQDIFKDVESLVLSALDGYNVCIFAYGQVICRRLRLYSVNAVHSIKKC